MIYDPIRHTARQLAKLGEGKDLILAHINADEAALLARLNGGAVNPVTGLPQFGMFDAIAGPISGLLGGGSSGSSGPGQTQYQETTQLTQPLTKEGKTLLNQYSTGTLSPADQLSLNAQTQAAKAAAEQNAASAGTGTSTMLANELGNIDIQSAEGRNNILKGYLNSAEGLYGTAFGPYEAALSQQFQGQQQAQSLLAGGIGSLFGALTGGGGSSSSGGSSGGGLGSLFSGMGSWFSSLFGGGGGSAASSGSFSIDPSTFDYSSVA